MSTWLHLLALALVSALSPASLVPAIFLLSRGGPRSVLAFALGSICSVAAITALVAGGLDVSGSGHSHGASEARAIFELAAGLLCFAFALRLGRRPPKPAKPADAEPSRFVHLVDRLGIAGAYLFGLVWVNGVFAIDAGLVIGQSGYGSTGKTVAVVAYAVAAAGGALLVYGVYRADPESSERRLAGIRAWMSTHSRAALALFLYAAAVLLVWKGAAGVLS
jgi:Sap, sulfolipid-1-addressing protein